MLMNGSELTLRAELLAAAGRKLLIAHGRHLAERYRMLRACAVETVGQTGPKATQIIEVGPPERCWKEAAEAAD